MTVSHATDPQPSSTGGKIHPATDYVVADASALAALTTTSTDLYKLAYQVSPPALYLLIGTGPALWKKLGIAGALATSEVVNDASAFGASGGKASDVQDALNQLAKLSAMNATLAHFRPNPGAATPFGVNAGGGYANAIGTATARTCDDTKWYTRRPRLGFVSSAGANSGAGPNFYTQAGNGWFSSKTGFQVMQSLAFSAVSTNFRSFMGLASGLITGGANPSTLFNICGLGADATDANMQIMTNDGTGTATKFDLGPNFPARTVDVGYALWLGCDPGASRVYWRVNRLDTPAMYYGYVAADLPLSSTLLFPLQVCGNGGDAVSVSIETFGYEVAVPLFF